MLQYLPSRALGAPDDTAGAQALQNFALARDGSLKLLGLVLFDDEILGPVATVRLDEPGGRLWVQTQEGGVFHIALQELPADAVLAMGDAAGAPLAVYVLPAPQDADAMAATGSRP